jgi:hypothetical protein
MYVANWLIMDVNAWSISIIVMIGYSHAVKQIGLFNSNFLDMCIIITQSSSSYQQRTWFGLPGRLYHRHSGRRRSPGEDRMRQQPAGFLASQRSHPESSPNTEASLHHVRRLRTVARWISWLTSIP